MRYAATGSRWGTFRWFGDEPMTDAEFLDQMSWERDLAGGGTLTITLPSGATVDRDRLFLYTIEVRSEHGTLIDTITEYFNGSMRQELDQASTLQFSIMGTHAAVADLVFPNRVWVRDRWGLLIEKFLIRQYKRRRQNDGIFLDVTCQGAIAALGIEPVKSYNTGYETDAVTGEVTALAMEVGDIVADLLDLQVQTPSIGLKKIDAAIRDYELVFSATDTTILGALRDLQALLPSELAGHFYLDSKARFNWRLKVGDHTADTIEIGGRLAGIELDTNLEDMFTRILVYGEGLDPETRLSLIDAGEANEYIESNTGTYGVIPRVVIEKSIRDPEQLLKVAQRLLEEFSTPAFEVTISALDLSKADGERFEDYNEFFIGSEYTVIDADQGINVDVAVVAIEYDFQQPIPVKIELKSRRRSLADVMAKILKSLAAPLEVDGNKYPTMGRNYTEAPTSPFHAYRSGDVRNVVVGNEVRPQMHCGMLYPSDLDANWQTIGNAQTWRVATFADFAALTLDENGDSGYTIDTGYWYVRKAGTFILISHFLA